MKLCFSMMVVYTLLHHHVIINHSCQYYLQWIFLSLGSKPGTIFAYKVPTLISYALCSTFVAFFWMQATFTWAFKGDAQELLQKSGVALIISLEVAFMQWKRHMWCCLAGMLGIILYSLTSAEVYFFIIDMPSIMISCLWRWKGGWMFKY